LADAGAEYEITMPDALGLSIGVMSTLPPIRGSRSLVTISCSTTAPACKVGSDARRYRRSLAAFPGRWSTGSSVTSDGSSSTALPAGVITRARITGLFW
jgi:hypothetical protein